jgi:hypothetical protein
MSAEQYYHEQISDEIISADAIRFGSGKNLDNDHHTLEWYQDRGPRAGRHHERLSPRSFFTCLNAGVLQVTDIDAIRPDVSASQLVALQFRVLFTAIAGAGRNLTLRRKIAVSS